MIAGETLLKLIDIPFAYTFLAIIFGVMNVNLSGGNVIILISAAGMLGTSLAIIDPVGRFLKFLLKNNIKSDNNERFNQDSVNAINTMSIGIEVDKIVSLCYTLIILILFLIGLVVTPEFIDNFISTSDEKNTVYDVVNIRILGELSLVLGIIFISVIGCINWYKLKKHVATAGTHLEGISSEFVTNATITNMTKAIERNDWVTAEKWKKPIHDEIITEKNKKDFNTEAVNNVYHPLYMENISIQVTAQNILNINDHSIELPSIEWDKISEPTLKYLIKDKFIANKLVELYKKIKNYNIYLKEIKLQIEKIVQEELESFYNKEIKTMNYNFKHDDGSISYSIIDCLRMEKHPLNCYDKLYQSKNITLEFFENKTEKLDDVKIGEFDIIWSKTSVRVKNDPMISKLINDVKEIQEINNDLKPKFDERINMQWS